MNKINLRIFLLLFNTVVSSFIPNMILFNSYKNNKPLKIHIHGGGNTAPYLLGILAYIKKNFDINNSIYSGVSAGTYISLISIFQNDLTDFDKLWKLYISDNKNYSIPIYEFDKISKTLSNNIIKNHQNDINISNINLNIYISKINNNYKTELVYHNKYDTFDDLIKLCECSCYLPYLSGSSFAKKYKNNLYIDGVFALNYNKIQNNDLIITKKMWNRVISPDNYLYCNYNNYKRLYDLGWEDTKKNHNVLEKKLNK